MNNRNRSRAYQPDMEDWWGDFDENVPPPPVRRSARRRPRQRRRGMSPASRAMMVLTGIVFLFCVCFQLYRLSLITGQNKQIQALRTQIDELTSEQQNLEVRLSLQFNLERIESEATNRLGMVYPSADQIRTIAVAGTNESVVTAYAAAEEGGQGNTAP